MKRIVVLLSLAIAVALLLTGCMQLAPKEEEMGGIRITIPPHSTRVMSIKPRAIPLTAEYIRVLIYDVASGGDFHFVVSIPLSAEGSSTDIAVPVGDTYTVRAISYLVSDECNYALTYDGLNSVAVAPNQVTPVSLILEPFTYTATGTASCVSGTAFDYSVSVTTIGDFNLSNFDGHGGVVYSWDDFSLPSVPVPEPLPNC